MRVWWSRVGVLVAVVLGIGGCIRAIDTTLVRDVGAEAAAAAEASVDGRGDGEPPDASPPPPLDRGAGDSDLAAAPDARDGAPIPDVAKLDTTVDATPKPDIVASLGGCASGTPIRVYGPDMVICSASGGTDQCSAQSACNVAGGWSLCNASQYVARGGATTADGSAAWLAGCVRAGATPFAPMDGICASCAIVSAPATGVAWRCSGTQSDTSNRAHLGLVTFVECRRAGSSDPGAGAYWRVVNTFESYSHAVCCH
ncbi:MAG: hypothetical protein KC503_40980 [Myxococcales bacterium]|nr:hypothetical protein [Myxococcales bacterium]